MQGVDECMSSRLCNVSVTVQRFKKLNLKLLSGSYILNSCQEKDVLGVYTQTVLFFAKCSKNNYRYERQVYTGYI